LLVYVTDLLASFVEICRMPGVAGGAPLLVGLLLAGLAGSVVHCAPMCGPFVLGQAADRMARIPAARLCEASRLRGALLLPYHAGRLTSYAALGGLAAGVAGTFVPGRAAGVLLGLAALVFAVHAARRLAPGLRALLPAIERAPPWWVATIGRLAGRIDRGHWSGGFLLGAALGFLPCGMLYAALLASASAGSAVGGAAGMLAFGLGTVPALVLVALAGQAAGQRWQRGVAVAAPVVMLANAAVLSLLAWQGLFAAG
jgi:sulfite exporter TauE/SafE